MTDLNLESKKRFYLFCKTVKSVARLSIDLFVKDLELSVLSPGQSVLKLFQEDR